MIGLLAALSLSLSSARPPAVSGLLVTPAVDPDANLVSRDILADGTIGECRRVMEDRPGWLPYRCETGPFLGRDVYRPLAAPAEIAASAEWNSPRQSASQGRPTFVIWRSARRGD